jgi:hypothetical protein
MESIRKYSITPAIGLFTGLIGVLFLPIGLKSQDYVTLVLSIGLLWGSTVFMIESVRERVVEDVMDELTEEEDKTAET